MHILRKLFLWTNILLVLVTLLAYLTPYLNPEYIWPFTFLGLGYPYLLIVNILFILLWVFRKKWYFLISLVGLLIGWQHIQQHVNINFDSPVSVKNEIRILTYNVKFLDYIFGKKNDKKAEARFLNFFRDPELPDIFCAQELSHRGFKFFKEELKYPYSKSIFHNYNVIFSKHPIVDSGDIHFDDTFNSCGWADVNFKGRIYRVYSAHLQSTKVSLEANNLAERKELRDKENLSDIKSMAKKIKSSVQKRTKQAKLIVAHMEKSPHPIIFCGDFNDTPVSYTYQILSQNLKDTFREKGHGLATSFAGIIPALRIDYILTDPAIRILDHKTHKVNFSDHYPVSSRLALP